MDAFLTRLSERIRSRRLLPRRSKLLVAVSGGLDSMVLLHALHRLRDRFEWCLEAAHFNHRLRGRASAADERFVRQQCDELGLNCRVDRWDPATRDPRLKEHGLEAAARLARHSFLGETLRNVGSRHLVLAHHADDQVELFFVRLLRGASARGLAGMKDRTRHGAPIDAWIVRPFLDCSRAELAAWAKTGRIRHREDASNTDQRFLRNRVRHSLLPLIRRQFPGTTDAVLLRTMGWLADDAEWSLIEADRFLKTPASNRPPFARCHPALQRQVLARQLEKLDLRFDGELLERLRRETDTPVNLPGNRLVSRNAGGRVVVHRPALTGSSTAQRTVNLTGRRGVVRYSGAGVEWSLERHRHPPKIREGRESFDADRIGPEIVLRHWRPGDRFQPIGMSAPVKLQNLFTNARIPQDERHRRVVATTGAGQVFWVEGLRIGERFKLTPTTRRVLVWRIRPATATGLPVAGNSDAPS